MTDLRLKHISHACVTINVDIEKYSSLIQSFNVLQNTPAFLFLLGFLPGLKNVSCISGCIKTSVENPIYICYSNLLTAIALSPFGFIFICT